MPCYPMKTILACLAFGFSTALFGADATATVYYASSKSRIYHLPTCKWAQKISKDNLITFSSKEEAATKGYRPCKVCKP